MEEDVGSLVRAPSTTGEARMGRGAAAPEEEGRGRKGIGSVVCFLTECCCSTRLEWMAERLMWTVGIIFPLIAYLPPAAAAYVFPTRQH